VFAHGVVFVRLQLSVVGMMLLHVIVPLLPTSNRYPDIGPYLITLYSFAHFVLFQLIFYRFLFVATPAPAKLKSA
jgi:hypothetical protein